MNGGPRAIDGHDVPGFLEEGPGDLDLDGAIVDDVDIERPAHPGVPPVRRLPRLLMVGDARGQVKAAPRRPKPLRPSRPSLIMSGMKKMLEPAVNLMNRLRYPKKFALISLLFAIPIGLMMSLWLVELHSRMAFTAKERAGLEVLVALRHVLEPLETSRGLRPLAEAGDPSAREGLAKEQVRIAAAATVNLRR